MVSIRRNGAFGLAAALVAAGALAVPASAGKSVSSEVTLKVKGGPGAAHGRVISKKPACVSDRMVILFMVAPDSAPIDRADRRTNAKGKWTFGSQLQGATAVKAVAKERKVNGVTCEKAVSPVKSF